MQGHRVSREHHCARDAFITAEPTLGQMWPFGVLTAAGDVGIGGQEGPDFAGSAGQVCQYIYQQTNADKTSES